MKPFLDENFLLQTKTAERLYHGYAKDLPIIDYHNHLSPEEIATDKNFPTLTEIWLKGDHYKWRAMRANGIDEAYITGDTSDEDKFLKWAETVPNTMRNPLYHWTHLELQRYFGIHDLLSPKTAKSIYEQANEQLQAPEFSVKNVLKKMNVEVVCTTDYPTDSLSFHQSHRQQRQSDSDLKMLPTFRPDTFMVIDSPAFLDAVLALEKVTGSSIRSFDQLLAGLENRIDFFAKQGCQLADHGLGQLFAVSYTSKALDAIFKKAHSGQPISSHESAAFQTGVLYHLGKMYHQRGWTMQLHLGAIRNNNSRLMQTIGADVGCDSIGDYPQAAGLSAFLDSLDKENKLPKTILYNLNPSDNELFATMMGNFNDGTIAGKIQWGSAWWFLDQKDGMEKQLNTLSNMGLLGRFIGMLTDSRSFLSFPRHEYFRRILCNLIGQDVHNGELPNDEAWLGKMVQGICYHNAREYFRF
ncbi:MAG: glucuronate isomerase [Bacteroidia bacterium]